MAPLAFCNGCANEADKQGEESVKIFHKITSQQSAYGFKDAVAVYMRSDF